MMKRFLILTYFAFRSDIASPFVHNQSINQNESLRDAKASSKKLERRFSDGHMLRCHERKGENYVDNTQLLNLLMPSIDCDVTQLSPTTLAYIGDAVFELFVRSRYAWPSRRTTQYREIVVGVVRAETQAKLLADLMEVTSPIEVNSILIQPLSQEELNVCRRGRNVGKNNNRTPKRLGGEAGKQNIYQDSTAWEALLGFLYIEYPQRCRHILSWVENQLEPSC